MKIIFSNLGLYKSTHEPPSKNSQAKMKIAIIGPGKMEIPPNGWGAVEILIWDYFTQLKIIGHDVHIINTPDPTEIIKSVNKLKPDFVHLHYDEYYGILNHIECKNKAVTSHYGYLEAYSEYKEEINSRMNHPAFKYKLFQRVLIRNRKMESVFSYKKHFDSFVNGPHPIYCLSNRIEAVYREYGFKGQTFIIPNGARDDLFKFSSTPKLPDRSVYLAKIDFRKKQFLYQSIPNLYFIGGVADSKFNTKSEFYLGSWTKDQIYENLTDFANLVLLSDGEAHPLVCCEALMAGLGLVVSEYASANLDLSLPFIDVIPKEKLEDNTYVSKVIAENRKKSIPKRTQIRNYAKEKFSWDTLVQRYSNHITEVCKK